MKDRGAKPLRVPYKQALELKKLGFDEDCQGFYTDDGIYFSNNTPIYSLTFSCKAPLFERVFQWFRNRYNLSVEIQTPIAENEKWNPSIHKIHIFGNHFDNDGFDTYEEAQLACLKRLIDMALLKN